MSDRHLITVTVPAIDGDPLRYYARHDLTPDIIKAAGEIAHKMAEERERLFIEALKTVGRIVEGDQRA